MDFYDLTPTEINDMITASVKRCEAETRSRAVFAWHTAYLTGIAVRAPKNFPDSPAAHFSWLDNEPEWKKHKRQMAQIAAQHNAARRGRK